MISLIYTPQRADTKAEYIVDNDILTIKIGKAQEIFYIERPGHGR